MKPIRFILSHALLLIFLIAIGMAYYYRAQLFTEKVTQKIDESVQTVLVFVKLAPQQAVQNEHTTSQESQASASTPGTVEQQSTEAVADSETQITKEEITAVTESAEAGQTAEEQTVVQTDTQQIADENTATAEVLPTEDTVTATDESEVATAVQTEQTPQASVASSDIEAVAVAHDTLINQARQAFHSGDSKNSVNLYQKLIDLNPDNPNYYGELGNVFYTQGKWKEAGQAYYEAATRLLSSGQHAQVMYLYRVIQGLDPESAEKLRSQIGR